ncbi:ABC transporter ATP-binding protein [Paenibacillus sp. YPG26]|uniref:ABC transporter ATP-binding protein n=1 Tax=Paenibacillus sp. YPG26 TaxID=2878915 RepID=UPI00203A4E67|nr:ABC transporter ATP-binding protein [Paenibacillus sp. YPG26]USB35075.1 ABC transporter ATP-binding protein [Paenibacillus sp. YPG26]
MLIVEHVDKSYKKGGLWSRNHQRVLTNISFNWKPGECLGIIGESGSGKSTLGRLLLGIDKPDQGRIAWQDRHVGERGTRLGSLSAVFQDYTSSINPFYTVEQAIAEPLKLLKVNPGECQAKVEQLLHQVGLNSSYRTRYPHELSGGEAQRVCIARALSTEPRCILLDEAISSLDGSVQIQILELLKSLRVLYNMGYIFITHDIQAAAYICDRIMILKDGQIEEIVRTQQLNDAQSPYTRKLLQMIIA